MRSLIGICAVLALALPVAAQADKKDELTELFTKLEAVVPKVSKAGYTVLHIEFDRLSKGAVYSLKRPMQKGHKYKVLGVGTPAVADIQVQVFDSKGKQVGEDQGEDSVGIVNLLPKKDATFSIRVKAAKLEQGQPYFFCLIASKPQK